MLYENGTGVTKSYVEAVKWYRLAAQQGYAEAQNNLGVMYESGHGVPRDPVEAAKWYLRAAEQGDANAQHNLGNRYQSGEGVAQNFAEAVKWYRKAAHQRHPMAQANLGVMYERGHGVKLGSRAGADVVHPVRVVFPRFGSQEPRHRDPQPRPARGEDDAGAGGRSAPAGPRVAAGQ